MSAEFYYMIIGMVVSAVAFRLWWRAVDRRHAREAAAQAAREHLRGLHARSDWDDVARPRTRHEKEVDRIWRTGALRPNQACQKPFVRYPASTPSEGTTVGLCDPEFPIYSPAMRSYATAQDLVLPDEPAIASGGGGDFGGAGASASYDDSSSSSSSSYDSGSSSCDSSSSSSSDSSSSSCSSGD